MAGPDNKQALRAYANRLAETLRETLGVDLPGNFADIFCWHARWVGPSSWEDLGQWVILECLEEKGEKGALDAAAVVRATDRIRHRIFRRGKREAQALSNLRDLRLADEENEPDSHAEDRVDEILESSLKRLTPIQLFLFEGHYLNGRSVDELGTELGISRATAYRMIKQVKNVLKYK